MFGKSVGEYLGFQKVVLAVIFVVWLVRLVLSLAGTPNATAKWISVTALVGIGVLYYSVRVHTSGFGSYKQLLVISVLLNLAAQVVIIFGIVLAIVTGTPNIYSAPEYAFGSDGATWSHAAAHLFIGTTAGSLGPWIIGSLVLFVTKKVSRADSKIKSLA